MIPADLTDTAACGLWLSDLPGMSDQAIAEDLRLLATELYALHAEAGLPLSPSAMLLGLADVLDARPTPSRPASGRPA